MLIVHWSLHVWGGCYSKQYTPQLFLQKRITGPSHTTHTTVHIYTCTYMDRGSLPCVCS